VLQAFRYLSFKSWKRRLEEVDTENK